MTEPAHNLWGLDTGDHRPGGDHFISLVESLRDLQDTVACSDPTAEVAESARRLIHRARQALEPTTVVPGRHYAGLRGDVPGRGHPLAVPVEIREWDADRVTGFVEFTPFFVGGGVAVHGGATALMFDELLGRLTNNGPPARTAYLRVDYRRVIPVGRRLETEAVVVRREGRKMFVRGEIRDQGQLLAEGEGLWVELRSEATAEERGMLE
jgi:acyl-coenzyme A thioesterase PaaI-like protein